MPVHEIRIRWEFFFDNFFQEELPKILSHYSTFPFKGKSGNKKRVKH